jgi:hypothetical protein
MNSNKEDSMFEPIICVILHLIILVTLDKKISIMKIIHNLIIKKEDLKKKIGLPLQHLIQPTKNKKNKYVMKNDTINKKKYINIINSNPMFKDTNVLKKIYSQRCSRKKIFSVSIQDGGTDDAIFANFFLCRIEQKPRFDGTHVI